MTNADVFDTDDLLLALLPALGPRSALVATRAMFKWGGTQPPLVVERSTLEFLDAGGRVIDRHEPVFGLAPGTRLEDPCSRSLADESRRPPEAVRQRWRLNYWMVESPVIVPEAEWGALHVTWLPLQLPLADDVHVVVTLVNLGEKPLDIARGVREAVCWVDGVPWRSVAGGVWNVRYLVEPNHSTTRRFRLADFPGAPTSGRHEIYLELLGRRSTPQTVQWHGRPWRAPAAGSPP